MTTAAAQPTPTTLSAQLLAALQIFDDAQGVVRVSARSFHGYEEHQLTLMPPFRHLPFAVISSLRDDMTLRVSPTTRSTDGAIVELPALVAFWTPETEFVGRAHVVKPAAAAAIASAIGKLPLPSLLIDGGHEVWCAWRLARPLSDAKQIATILTQFAERIGANTERLQDLLAFDAPLSGWVRNWNATDRDAIAIVEANPSRVYEINDLMKEKEPRRR